MDDFHKKLLDVLIALYPLGPLHNSVWEKMDGRGSFSQIIWSGTGEDQWYSAIWYMSQGGNGCPTIPKILEVLQEDFPKNHDVHKLINWHEQ